MGDTAALHRRFPAAKALTGKNSVAYVRDYPKNRGMNFSHDTHDWLGGYPYETASAEEMRERVAALGFEENSLVPPAEDDWPVRLGLQRVRFQEALGVCAPQQTASLFDHLVGLSKQ